MQTKIRSLDSGYTRAEDQYSRYPGIEESVRPRILIVEDEEILAEDIKEILEKSGYEVCSVCSSGEEAIENFTRLKPDGVLMDIHLKGKIDGIDAAAQITSKSSIPVVFLTAYHDTETLSRAKDMNPYGFLVKPFVRETLHTTLQIALSKNRHDNRIRSLSAWLCLTFRNLDRGIITIDRKGKIILMNSRAESLTGWTLENANRLPLEDVLSFHDSTRNQPYVPLTSAVLSEGLIVTFPSDILVIAKDGKRNTVKDCVLSPIQEKDGAIAGAILVFTPDEGSKTPVRPSRIEGDEVPSGSLFRSGKEQNAPTIRIHDIRQMIRNDISLEQATLSILLGKYEEAESIYTTLIQKDPDNFQLWHNMGNVLTKLGRHRESIQAFDRALNLNPASAESQRRRSDVLAILSMKKTRR